ncbi:unnamed protein product [Cochlearia groenlandica]
MNLVMNHLLCILKHFQCVARYFECVTSHFQWPIQPEKMPSPLLPPSPPATAVSTATAATFPHQCPLVQPPKAKPDSEPNGVDSQPNGVDSTQPRRKSSRHTKPIASVMMTTACSKRKRDPLVAAYNAVVKRDRSKRAAVVKRGRGRPKKSKKDDDVAAATVKDRPHMPNKQKKLKKVADKLAIAVIAMEEIQAIADGM